MSSATVESRESRVESKAVQQHLSPNQRAWLRFKNNKAAKFSAVFLFILLAVILAWPWISPYKPEAVTEARFDPPSWQHWFGTDVHGRDLLTRVFYGARISLIVGAVGACVSLIIGVSWGAIAGYVGGRTDNAMMRIVDILYALPSIIFVIVLKSTFEKDLKNWLSAHFSPHTANYASMVFLFIGLGAVSWLTMARIVRGQVLSLRTRNFVEASKVLGASHARILWKHILPNVYGVIITYLTLTVPAIILYESFLSFLGLGIQPPHASWGTLIAEGVTQINPIRTFWWLLVFPGAMLVSTLLALNFVGDGLRDAFDPRANK